MANTHPERELLVLHKFFDTGLFRIMEDGDVQRLRKNGEYQSVTWKTKSGYWVFSSPLIEGKCYTMLNHRMQIVCSTRKAIPERMLIEHMDENNQNNHVTNLAVGTEASTMVDRCAGRGRLWCKLGDTQERTI